MRIVSFIWLHTNIYMFKIFCNYLKIFLPKVYIVLVPASEFFSLSKKGHNSLPFACFRFLANKCIYRVKAWWHSLTVHIHSMWKNFKLVELSVCLDQIYFSNKVLFQLHFVYRKGRQTAFKNSGRVVIQVIFLFTVKSSRFLHYTPPN